MARPSKTFRRCSSVPRSRRSVLPTNPENIESLHGLPNLARLSYFGTTGGESDKSASQFWAEYQGEEPWIVTLRKANITFKHGRLADTS